MIAAPVIVNARLLGALTAYRDQEDPFPPGTEVGLRNFSDLAAQSIANAQAHEELRASRARIMNAADEARAELERNLHDGAQQRLVAVSISLHLALAKLDDSTEETRAPVVCLGRADAGDGGPARARTRDSSVRPHRAWARAGDPGARVERRSSGLIENGLEERLPSQVEAAAYYVVAEALTNVAKYAEASQVDVQVYCRNGSAIVEVVDDGIGGADPARGSGLRGLADRVEALDGRLVIEACLPAARGSRPRSRSAESLPLCPSRVQDV